MGAIYRDLFVSLFRRHEIEILGRQGAIDERLLLAGRVKHVVVHEAQLFFVVDLDARFDDPLGERKRERAVAFAVLGARAALCGIDDQGPARRLDRRQSPADRSVGDGQFHLRGKRIVSARIQNDQLQLARAFDRGLHLIDAKWPQRERRDRSSSFGIGGNQIVCSPDLDAVPGVINDGPIGAVRLPRERLQRGYRAFTVEIMDDRNILDPRAPQGRANQVGVARRVRQTLRRAIGGIADYQRDAPIQGSYGQRRCRRLRFRWRD